MTVTVYLLDDHEVVREGIRALLESGDGIRVIGGSGTVAQALQDIPRLAPDVAVLDGRLPDGSGIEVCREVRSARPEIKALILTSYDDEEALFSAIMAGASGYVLKEIRGNDLVAAVRLVAAGGSMIDSSLAMRVLERMRNPQAKPERLRELTERELELLGHIARGLTNRQIAAEMFLAEKTVKNYVSQLLGKLGVESRTRAAVLANELLK